MKAHRQAEKIAAATARKLPDFRGKQNLARRWQRLTERREGSLNGEWSLNVDGDRYLLPRGSAQTWAFAWTGAWEATLRKEAMREVEPGGVLVDVGASLGLWTVPLARLAQQTQRRVAAFEPFPPNHAWLARNVEANGLSDVVTIYHDALGAEAGSASVESDEAEGGSAAIGVGTFKVGMDVQVNRLDDIELPGRLTFIKLDVEGQELDVLEGARARIEQDRPVIYGEFSRVWLAHRRQDPAPLLEWFCAIGYEVASLKTARPAAWRSQSLVERRPLAPPFSDLPDDLLLTPR